MTLSLHPRRALTAEQEHFLNDGLRQLSQGECVLRERPRLAVVQTYRRVLDGRLPFHRAVNVAASNLYEDFIGRFQAAGAATQTLSMAACFDRATAAGEKGYQRARAMFGWWRLRLLNIPEISLDEKKRGDAALSAMSAPGYSALPPEDESWNWVRLVDSLGEVLGPGIGWGAAFFNWHSERGLVFRLPPPGLIMGLALAFADHNDATPAYTAGPLSLERVRDLMARDERPVRVSFLPYSVHWVHGAHPYLGLYHDLYHLMALGGLPIDARTDVVALFDCCQEVLDDSTGWKGIDRRTREKILARILDFVHSDIQGGCRQFFVALKDEVEDPTIIRMLHVILARGFQSIRTRQRILSTFEEVFGLDQAV